MSKRSRDVSISREDTDLVQVDDPEMPMSKLVEVDRDSSSNTTTTTTLPRMHCDLPPHKETLSFATYEEYEVHYAKSHTNRCSACGKNFPTNHFLSLHIEENHNPLREVLASRGEKTYGCFVEDCDRKCSTPQKRRLHLIDKHMFPKTYNFRIIDKGIDQIDSLLSSAGPRRRLSGFHESPERRRTSERRISSTQDHKKIAIVSSPIASTETASEIVSKQAQDSEMDHLNAAMSALQFVPPSVRMKQQNQKRTQP